MIFIIITWLATGISLIAYFLFRILKTNRRKAGILYESYSFFANYLVAIANGLLTLIFVGIISILLLISSFIITIIFRNFADGFFLLSGTIAISYLSANTVIYYYAVVKGGAKKFNESDFLLSAGNGNYKMVKRKIRSRVNINCVDINGNTALHFASSYGHLDIVKLLVTKGAKINVSDSNQSTPIFDAIKNVHLEVVKYLLQVGASLSQTDKDGCTPLLAAVYANKSNELIKLLIASGSDLNYQNSLDGQTALMVAEYFGNNEIANSLLMNGANIRSIDKYGLTAYHYAKTRNN